MRLLEWFEDRLASSGWRGDVVVASVAGVLAVLVRLPGLATPSTFVFDEIYYADDALHLVTEGSELAGVAHPPFGKVLIALGIRMAGFTPEGWRLAVFVSGIATVAVTAVVARRLSGSALIGLAAGVVVTTDGTAFTMGRLAMLDGLVMLPIVAGIGILLVASDREQEISPARVAAAGAVLGLGCAVKWSVLPVLVVAAVFVGWQARRRASLSGAIALGGLMLATATVVYGASYVQYVFVQPEGVRAPVTEATRMARFHGELEIENSYAGPVWQWWTSPATLWEEPCRPDSPTAPCRDAPPATVATISAVPSLVTVLAFVGWGAHALARRRRPGAGEVLLLAGVAVLLAPWAVGGRLGYSYYLAAAVPLAVALSSTGVRAARPAVQRLVAMAVIGGAVALFLLQRPQLVGLPR